MPTTRKKVIKTVYKDESDSNPENGDFSDSGSEAVISQPSSSSGEDEETHTYLEDKKEKKKIKKIKPTKSKINMKALLTKVSDKKRVNLHNDESDSDPKYEPKFCIKDLTDADKLLPSILNLSESDSSDDETPIPKRQTIYTDSKLDEIEMETETEYKDVWSNNLKNSEEIAQKAFLELEKHKSKLEETKQSIQKYSVQNCKSRESDVKDLLALGEEVLSLSETKSKRQKTAKTRNDSDSDMEDWEEVAESKTLPQQGLQLVVDFPDAARKKTKKLDMEMMLKRKMNRVKKEYQVYMHKVHVLCWLGHGNYVSEVLNDQDIMSAALSLIPSQECYPGERVDIKYVEQITTWFKDKLNIKYDKNDGKYKPKAPPLKTILLEQIKTRVVTSKKYVVFIFVSMLRALGLQCRIMLNFITLPIKPLASELCSLSTKTKSNENSKEEMDVKTQECKKKKIINIKIPQLDGNNDSLSDSDFDKIMQLDGNNDGTSPKRNKSEVKVKNETENRDAQDVSPPKRSKRNLAIKKGRSEFVKKIDSKTNDKNVTENVYISTCGTTQVKENKTETSKVEDVSPPKRPRRNLSIKRVSSVFNEKLDADTSSKRVIRDKRNNKEEANEKEVVRKFTRKTLSLIKNMSDSENQGNSSKSSGEKIEIDVAKSQPNAKLTVRNSKQKKLSVPTIVVTNIQAETNVASEYFDNLKNEKSETKRDTRTRKRSHTCNPNDKRGDTDGKDLKKLRAKSAPGTRLQKSKYFAIPKANEKVKPDVKDDEDCLRVSHRNLGNSKKKPNKNDITKDLVKIIKKRVSEAKLGTKKGKSNKSSDEDSDYLPEVTEPQISDSTKKIKAKPGTSRMKDRRVLSTDDEAPSRKIDTWCEVYVEELEQWIAVDIIKGRVHCVNEVYSGATHPVNYVVGWDNNNYLKDLTRRYVPHWNTVTRKQRVDTAWWEQAVRPWLGPKTPRDREEDNSLDRLQLDAPLPKVISEYKNHPLYALKRHLLKFEALYPPDAATLGFVRGEAVYARDCVYVCRSRDTWLKEAKVVRLGEKPYKVVKARPKWDKLSNKLITDKPLEVFGPWQVQDYEPPVAENGLVPRNAYGNVELFKDCMLPKGTVHIKLPGLNRVAKKLDIDCAPAMTGFDFNGGWSHPVYDGFVVCKEFKEIITNAWQEDQLEQERKEKEKLEARVYGNWRRLIKGLLIRERLKLKYGFSEPTTSQETKKKTIGPRLVLKKKCLDK